MLKKSFKRIFSILLCVFFTLFVLLTDSLSSYAYTPKTGNDLSVAEIYKWTKITTFSDLYAAFGGQKDYSNNYKYDKNREKRVMLGYSQGGKDWYVEALFTNYSFDNSYNGMYTGVDTSQNREVRIGADTFMTRGDCNAFYFEYMGDTEPDDDYFTKDTSKNKYPNFSIHGCYEDGSRSDYMLCFAEHIKYGECSEKSHETNKRNSYWAKRPENNYSTRFSPGYLYNSYGYYVKDGDGIPKFNYGTISDVTGTDVLTTWVCTKYKATMDTFFFFNEIDWGSDYYLSHDVSVGAYYYGDNYFGAETVLSSNDTNDIQFYIYVGEKTGATYTAYGTQIIGDYLCINKPVYIKRGDVITITKGGILVVSSSLINEGTILINGGTLIVSENGRIFSMTGSAGGNISMQPGSDFIIMDDGKVFVENRMEAEGAAVVNYGTLAINRSYSLCNMEVDNHGFIFLGKSVGTQYDMTLCDDWNSLFANHGIATQISNAKDKEMVNVKYDSKGNIR